MTTIDEIDEAMDFVNWDAAGADTGFDFQSSQGVPGQADETNMDLVLGDVEGDDWSFWALQHYESTQNPEDLTMQAFDEPLGPMAEPLSAPMYWVTPEAPCGHCALGGYQCKRIQEGNYKGYCTSCVALRCECSFGPLGNHAGSEAGDTFPANPWPIMGDRPEHTILHEDELAALVNPTLSSLNPLEVGANADTDGKHPSPSNAMPKIGARFSRESVRILKNWVSTHSRHPYPTEEEKESLQKITGLNKTQIANWLANARRRGKILPTRSTSPHIGRGYIQAIDIPKRRGTPGFEDLNPLQRWANSPPENEPASVTAIARAVTASSSAISSSSGRNSPHVSGYSDDGSSKSLCNQSSASSFSNSHGSSGGSFASSFSHQSRGSFGSIPSFAHSNRGRRRRRRAPPKPAEKGLQQPLKTYQCTFCTETFRTKHDWQRHEKSLHLSLERWICSPDGAKSPNAEAGLMNCVFCGEAGPDDKHIESHNFTGCTERTVEERTFYRKDHLRQHLKLVHNAKFLPRTMDVWRVSSPEIRSRCGFCGTVLDSWSIRVDHLAEHFKTGNTMADWKGDWGFDAPVLEMVENSIPPYLIHDERNSPLPYMASQSNPSTPNNAYELLKFELQYWAHNLTEDTGRSPTDDDLQQEACRIVFGSEVSSRNPAYLPSSWLRELIFSRDDITKTVMYQPVRKQAENRMSSLRINGKDNIFEGCELEGQLQEFVKARQLLGLTAMDHELQTEACRIMGRMEEKSGSPSEDVANWLVRLIHASPKWLTDFRKRAQLPRSEDIVDVNERSKDPMLIDSTIHNYSRLERELTDFLQVQRAMGQEPLDADLQRQARLIIYENEDDWNQTAADDAEWLTSFKQRHAPLDSNATVSTSSSSPTSSRLPFPLPTLNSDHGKGSHQTTKGWAPPSRSMRPGPFFLNDANCYRRLAKGLSRFVASTMSVNNPNCHIPTDDELQHQARWIVYDDDDPWNQTSADNAEWLQRFKRDAGILSAESGPGLPTDILSWNISGGGTGFAPPYVSPNPQATLESIKENPKIFCRENTKSFEAAAATANHFLETFQQRYPAPAKVFCSRELENGMVEYVKREMSKNGAMPSDDQLRDRARQIMSMQKTPADDPTLLEKFKAAMEEFVISAPVGAGTLPAMSPLGTAPDVVPEHPVSAEEFEQPSLFGTTGANTTLTDQEVDDILCDMSNSLGDGGILDFNVPT
ncbi:C2H2 type zinc finger-containing protein [Xylariales sp. AK1849]|nr:C2H2 type zinc finger-containing protein [Xylariales sp. AK1849]